MLKSLLIVAHVGAGFVSLAAAAMAIAARIFPLPHKVHVLAGRVFVVSMLTVCISALALGMMTGNAFLVLLAIFSGYLASVGWSSATNRSGTPTLFERGRAWGMCVAAVAMICYGIAVTQRGGGPGIVSIAFGTIALLLAGSDVRALRQGGRRGPLRIVKHLTMMLGATNAAVTAFVVVNFTFRPQFVLWLVPTACFVPMIILWSCKYRKAGAPAAESAGTA